MPVRQQSLKIRAGSHRWRSLSAEGLSASILRFLVFNGADVSHAPTILHALLASDAVTAEHVQVLLDAGASESGTNALGQTPLDVAMARGLGEDILSLLR